MKFEQSFLNKSIRTQIKAIVFAMILLFVFLCGLISESIHQLILNNEDEHMQITATRIRDQIGLANEKIENFCINISEDETVQVLMKSDYTEMSVTMHPAMECLTKYKVLEPMIEDISLVNDRIHYSAIMLPEELDRIREQVNGVPFVLLGFRSRGFASEAGKTDRMVYGGDIISGKKNIGTVIISVDASGFFDGDDMESNKRYFLADREGILFSIYEQQEEMEEIYRFWAQDGWPEWMKEGGYALRSSYLEELGCYLVSVLDMENMGMGMTRIQLLIWGCVLLAAVFCLVFFGVVSRGIVRPLHQFHGTIRQISQSNQRSLETELELKGCAEIAELGHEFSAMLEHIQELSRKIFKSATDLYEMKVQKQEAEMAYLRSQIDPHFLYNTLEVIRKMAMEKEAPEIGQMAFDMGNIFRYSAKGGDEVDLEEEISIIKSYIRIQQMRFAGKIEVYYFIQEDTLRLRVMKMLLQPIVENAIFHGLEPKNGSGSLYIGARTGEGELMITVKDDGVGICQEYLKELHQRLLEKNADTREHVGILNTNARVRLAYGEQYGISIESCSGDGTTVVIRLPARRE